MWHPSYNRVCRESELRKGMASFIYQDVAQRFRPIPVVALYNPPLGSRLNKGDKHYSDDIMFAAELESRRLWEKYGFVMAPGDFNWRLGSSFGRSSDDDVKHGANARTEIARQWISRTSLRPLHGRSGQCREELTSRTHSGLASPDGIYCPKVIPIGWSACALPPPAWETYSTAGGVHRPIGVVITSPLLLPAYGNVAGRGPVEDPGVEPAVRVDVDVVFRPHPYGHKAYHDMSPDVEKCIVDAATHLRIGLADGEQTMKALSTGLVAVQQLHFEARQTLRGRRKAQCRQDLRRRNPTTVFRRVATGVAVPKDLKSELAKKRKTLARMQALKQLGRRQGTQWTPEQATEHSEREKAAALEVKTLTSRIKRSLNTSARVYYASEARRLAHMLRHNPHRFFRTMRTVLPQADGSFDESSGATAAQGLQFQEFFAKLFKKMTEYDGTAAKFLPFIPTTGSERSRLLLMAKVTWEEVYYVLFPTHTKVVRQSCDPDCKLCPHFAAHIAAARPGDTRLVQPEHRPRLWTSKSAGPDGVFAETLRWACPEARAERLPYRERVCRAFAEIFNSFLDKGEVPECPQFAEAAMSVLYKGKGDRNDADSYRGICVPNVLAKLFGLVLGTRLSHWAILNGVISPEQVGFIVMHGCEYHIFTLLEALRHRVRQDRNTVLVFVDFKKAYDNVSQDMAWDLMEKMGVPAIFTGILKSWAIQSRVTLSMGGVCLAPFAQEKGVPQGGVLSPIIFNFVMEVLLRYVNSNAQRLGIEVKADAALHSKSSAVLPPPLWLLALAYADDVVLICPNRAAAAEAVDLVQEWAEEFGFTIGVGGGKTEAMIIDAEIVKVACAADKTGELNPKLRSQETLDGVAAKVCSPSFTDRILASDDDDDGRNTVIDSESDSDDADDPTVDEAKCNLPKLRPGQRLINGVIRGCQTRRPLPFEARPLPPVPTDLPLLIKYRDGSNPTTIPWTVCYKYLGYKIRSDLIDDDAFARVESKTLVAIQQLLPYHRLVRAFPLGQKIQLLRTLALSATANIVPLLTSMRNKSDKKLIRLDAVRKKAAQQITRLHPNSDYSYVMAEAGLGDVLGDVTMHRIRFALSLELHPMRNAALLVPVACRMFDIMKVEAQFVKQFTPRGTVATPACCHSLLLPWTSVTNNITATLVRKHADQQWLLPPEERWEVSPYASAVARIGESDRWISDMRKDAVATCCSFMDRPPSNGKRHSLALHWPMRLNGLEAGKTPKLTPLSCRGPHGFGSIVALSRIQSGATYMISKARQGNSAMHHYPFASLFRAGPKVKGQIHKPSGAAKAIAFDGKTCHLCCNHMNGPGYDLWHVLFECSATVHDLRMIQLRGMIQDGFLGEICGLIEAATMSNGDSLADTREAGIDHQDIITAAFSVRLNMRDYNWDCMPGKWLQYMLLLALPFPAKVVAPPRHTDSALTNASQEQLRLPLAVGKLFDATVLTSDSLRPLADKWCWFAIKGLRLAGSVVCPKRTAADLRMQPVFAARKIALRAKRGAHEPDSDEESDSVASDE